MRSLETRFGQVLVGSTEEIYSEALSLAEVQRRRTTPGKPFLWALSGGSTPQDWFAWCLTVRAFPHALVAASHFTVSDERHVALSDAQSNFGSATRLLLDPLEVAPGHRHPWPVELPPHEAAAAYEGHIASIRGEAGYDLCMLGLGSDAHTASFFPGSPLLAADDGKSFAAVDAGSKGWRLTITPSGLARCGRIVVMVTGSTKAAAVGKVFGDSENPIELPAQILRRSSDSVVWLLDEAAAAELRG